MTFEEPQTWHQFLDWLPHATPRGDVEEMLRDYRAWMAGQGASEEQAHQAIGVIMRRLNDPDQHTIDGWRQLFDKVFTSNHPKFRTEPNALLAAVVSDRPAGRALDVCMGEGRNTVFLAEHGWQTTGVDVSTEGLARARERARAASVTVSVIRGSAMAFDYDRGVWDLVAFLYAPVPITDPAFVARATSTVRPGGVVVVESFASDSDAPNRRPVDIDPRDLRAAFGGFDIQRLDDVVDRPDWADAPQRMVRMIAAKATAG